MKWFSISGIAKEVNRIRWPKVSELTTFTIEVIIFCVFFGIFFVAAEFVIAAILTMLGIGV